MKCHEARQLLIHDATGAEDLSAELEQHLQACDDCLDWADAESSALLGPGEALSDVEKVLMKRSVRAALTAEPVSAPGWSRWVGAAAILVLAAGLVWVASTGPGNPDGPLNPKPEINVALTPVPMEEWSGEALADVLDSGLALEDDGLDSLLELAEYHPQWAADDFQEEDAEEDWWLLGDDPLYDDVL